MFLMSMLDLVKNLDNLAAIFLFSLLFWIIMRHCVQALLWSFGYWVLFPNKESIIYLTENSCCIWLFSKLFWVVAFSSKNCMYYMSSFWLKTYIFLRSVTSWLMTKNFSLLTRVTYRDILDCVGVVAQMFLITLQIWAT